MFDSYIKFWTSANVGTMHLYKQNIFNKIVNCKCEIVHFVAGNFWKLFGSSFRFWDYSADKWDDVHFSVALKLSEHFAQKKLEHFSHNIGKGSRLHLSFTFDYNESSCTFSFIHINLFFFIYHMQQSFYIRQ